MEVAGHRGSVACQELCGGHGPGSCGYFRGSGTHPLSGRNQPWGRQEVLGACLEGAGGLLAGEGCPGAGSPPPRPPLHPPHPHHPPHPPSPLPPSPPHPCPADGTGLCGGSGGVQLRCLHAPGCRLGKGSLGTLESGDPSLPGPVSSHFGQADLF